MLKHAVQWIFLEDIALFDVAMDHFFGFMAGLAHDGKGIEVMLGCTCCKAAPQTMAGKISLVQANLLYVFFDDERYGFI